MISTGELRKGVTIELDNELWQILDYHHIKMGRGSAQVRITLRNVKRGQTVERSFQAGTKWPRAQMEQRPVQFLYRDGDDFHFMDTDTYDQFMLRGEQLGERDQLPEGRDDARPDELPGRDDRRRAAGDRRPARSTTTEPGFAGDTAQGARKPATTETGLVVQVPLFVERGRHDPRRYPDRGVPDAALDPRRQLRQEQRDDRERDADDDEPTNEAAAKRPANLSIGALTEAAADLAQRLPGDDGILAGGHPPPDLAQARSRSRPGAARRRRRVGARPPRPRARQGPRRRRRTSRQSRSRPLGRTALAPSIPASAPRRPAPRRSAWPGRGSRPAARGAPAGP